MELKDQLISTLLDNLKGESIDVLEKNVERFKSKEPEKLSNIHEGIEDDIFFKGAARFRLKKSFDVENARMMQMEMASYSSIRGTIFKLIFGILLIGGISFLLYFGGKYLSEKYSLKLYLSILIEIGAVISLILLYFFIRFSSRYTYEKLEKKFDSIKPKDVEVKRDFDDEVYFIISTTYETLSDFRKERERQARNTFNAALGLIIAGILIVFVGVYLLFRKNITEGSVTSSVGAISNILGGTIIKFYRDTNNRMDSLNNDLFVLNTAKVQYAMILKISDSNKRDLELSELIKSIGKIKSTGYNTRYSQ
jgi:hypothetical protein